MRAEASVHAAQMQGQVEGVLKMQVATLKDRLESSMEGRQAESEMADEAVVKAVKLENHLEELTEKVHYFYSYLILCNIFTTF